MVTVVRLSPDPNRRVRILAKLHDAAVLDVGAEDGAVTQHHRVVGIRELLGIRTRVPGRPVPPHDAMSRDVDHAHDEVVFFGGDDLFAVCGEERVVGNFERLPGSEIAGPGKLPHDIAARVDLDEPIVALVRDQERTGQRRRITPRSEESGARRARYRRRRCRCVQCFVASWADRAPVRTATARANVVTTINARTVRRRCNITRSARLHVVLQPSTRACPPRYAGHGRQHGLQSRDQSHFRSAALCTLSKPLRLRAPTARGDTGNYPCESPLGAERYLGER